MTPKTFPKYISKIKKLAEENGWSLEQYQAALAYLSQEVDKEEQNGARWEKFDREGLRIVGRAAFRR